MNSDSRSNYEILLGLEPGQEFPKWDLLNEIFRRDKRKGMKKKPISAARKEANKRAHRHSEAAKAWSKQYHKEVVSPRRKATRQWMREHPEEVNEIKARRVQELSPLQQAGSSK